MYVVSAHNAPVMMLLLLMMMVMARLFCYAIVYENEMGVCCVCMVRRVTIRLPHVSILFFSFFSSSLRLSLSLFLPCSCSLPLVLAQFSHLYSLSDWFDLFGVCEFMLAAR